MGRQVTKIAHVRPLGGGTTTSEQHISGESPHQMKERA